MDSKDRPMFPISIIKEQTGLTGRQIRYYEARGIISPGRTAGNRRVFSLYDLEILQKAVVYLEQGMGLEAIRTRLREEEEHYYRQKLPEPTPGAAEGPAPPLVSSIYPVINVKSLTDLIARIRKDD